MSFLVFYKYFTTEGWIACEWQKILIVFFLKGVSLAWQPLKVDQKIDESQLILNAWKDFCVPSVEVHRVIFSVNTQNACQMIVNLNIETTI